ncbi:T9SS type A sorting domain-containing protein [Flavobacterium psychrophilum]|uniref:T9SS type A sorting domain-containing protein n=1 Tax=Flavobacterium psychrophilum TaxID=96345 RepID=UPI000B7C472E|nr:T9SS type A sorting domain-containing protein [Flavobacterium psychrophilum]ELM3726004.1 T9SS type A sorting domain-containing protein [Flavobacterium psychrophilum]ELY1979777.1 T9SS type A sorting domain-containing protein [Flavobacterium psychrophilum]MCB6088394.1 T9SS type A sorting domain-containing protein [Flavobacterium psychrophilum]MCB6231692.1 T9SS type A sorting domain-containing protein [Flavobacterium psychrophilum]QZK97749.1 T9SS type A sorting domain-containing protein [Flavo
MSKKNLCIVILLLLNQFVFSQTKITTFSRYRLNVTGYVGLWGDDCGSSYYPGLHWVVGHYSGGGGPMALFQASVPFPGDLDGYVNSGFGNWGNVNTNYTNQNVISHIRIKTSKREENWLGDCGGSEYTEAWISINKAQNSVYSFQNLGLNQPGHIIVASIPTSRLQLLDNLVDFVGDEDDIIFNEINFGVDNQYYNYKFSVTPFNLNPVWQSFPSQFQNNKDLTIKAKDIFINTTEPLNGSYFKVMIDNNFGYPIPGSNANFIILKYLKSAPHISDIVVVNATCFNDTNGSLKINLDRALLYSEILGCEIYNVTTSSVQYSVPAMIGNPNLGLSIDRKSIQFNNLPAGQYKFKITVGGLNGYPTYTMGVNHKIDFQIEQPPLVDFSLSKVDVWCNGGNDGSITINATGGNLLDATADGTRYYYSVNNGNWLPFSSETTHVLSNLLPGTYTIKVRDFKDCYARTPQEIDKVLTETIIQPALPVSLTYTQIVEPTFYGGTNGRIVAAIKGGTRFADNSYLFEWRNSTGILQTNITPFYDPGSASYYLTLNGIPSDTYTLTVKDKNFSNATNQIGCTVFNSTQFLGQPEPIVVTLNITKSISCNVTNPFGNETDFNPTDGQRDESQDGIIQATVTGGVAFTGFENNGLPYKFYWKKQQTNGTWINWNDNDATAENVSHGNYSLNVEDKNGIRLGVYVNNLISQETPKTQFIQQPDKLELNFQKGDISCSSGNNGWVKAIPTGGTAPYLYEWTTGDTTEQINNIIANNYFVKVTDAKGCIVQGSSIVQQPNGVEITETITNPTCDNGNDGSVVINITGGTQPFTYSWSSGQFTRDISNLTAGNYRFTLVDAQGCTYFKDIVLTNPAPILVDLGNDRTLCNNQSLDLDISINDALAQYVWTSDNGFTSSSSTVSLTNSGTYTAKIISSKGCTAQDDIIIKTSNVNISSEFFLSSQAYLNEEVVLVNASNPLGENTVWQIPNNVSIVSQTENYIVLKFPTIGSYTISLKQTQGDCYALYSKIINVEAKTINSNIGNTSNPFISEFSVTPNPSNGNFSAIVKLEESSPIKLRLYALNGQLPLIEKSETGQKSYVVNFNINLAAGTYALILETAKQTLVKKIIIY